MSLTDLQVTVDDVLAELPLDTSQVTSSSEPVSTGDIENWIQDGTSELANTLKRSGVVVDQLDGDSLQQLQKAVESYAVAQALDATGFLSERMEKYRRKWRELRDRYAANPQSVSPNRTSVQSSQDPDSADRSFQGHNFTSNDYQW
jgi:hypothetical protein